MTEEEKEQSPIIEAQIETEEIEIPSEMPVLPLRSMVFFPGLAIPIVIGREKSLKLIESIMLGNKLLGAVAQKDSTIEEPSTDDLYEVGTVCRVVKLSKRSDGATTAVAQGLQRFKVKDWMHTDPFFKASIDLIEDEVEKSKELEALTLNLKKLAARVIELAPNIPSEVGLVIQGIDDPGMLLDFVAGGMTADVSEKQDILETTDVKERFEKVTRSLTHQLDVLELGDKIQKDVRDSIDKSQREFFLRQQLKAIQDELGEGDERKAEQDEIEDKIEKAKMPPEVEKQARHELNRMQSMPTAAPEHSVIRTYLDWLTDMPWSKGTKDELDIPQVRKILDEDHHDLEKVKDRILEYLAVRKLREDPRGPILCFVGPPGVGKTSLGKSIARAMGREFVRISLGGVRDEAEIRGHRRTYVGALPGRIIQGIKKAGTRNPVFMMDEVDKIGMDFRGDPSSALLEVLDPEQNNSFSDHYLDVPFDLSRVMFITTANILDTIPPALRDRMEVMELPGYTDEEKLMIAKKYLVKRQLEENGLSDENLSISDDALKEIISSYTREAGVRNLEREISTVCRKVATAIAEGKKEKAEITADNLHDYLGPERFYSEVAERTEHTGVATGLVWTPVGGDIVFVEATRMPGTGKLVLTGQLGDVMKESAQAALSFVLSKADEYDVPEDFSSKYDIHIHVPAGAIRKDGPSAGVTMLAALVSLLMAKPVRSDVAMTGEITLRGSVLPVGGIKEKVLAAERAGIKTIILPERNKKDLVDVPEEIREKLEFQFVKEMKEVIDSALK
jgi:ATP-dependent Lon protease